MTGLARAVAPPTPALDKRLAAIQTPVEGGVYVFHRWLLAQKWRYCIQVEPPTEWGTYLRWQAAPERLIDALLMPYRHLAARSEEIGNYLDMLNAVGIDICAHHASNYAAVQARMEREYVKGHADEYRYRGWAEQDPAFRAPVVLEFDYQPEGWYPIRHRDPRTLLEMFFGIDADACERELRMLLDAQRALNEAVSHAG